MKIKVAVVENDGAIREELSTLLTFYGIFEKEIVFDDINEANDFLISSDIDVVFANISVGDYKNSGDGSYLAINLAENCPEKMVILYSKEQYSAEEIYACEVLDYMRFPFEPMAMQRVVKRIRNQYELLEYKRRSITRSIMIKSTMGYRLVNLNDVLFIERINRKNRMITSEGKEIYLSGYTLDELEKLLCEYNFYRCYQSFIVNLSKISFIKVNNETKNYLLQFEGYAGEISISRDKYNKILKLLKERFAKLSL